MSDGKHIDEKFPPFPGDTKSVEEATSEFHKNYQMSIQEPTKFWSDQSGKYLDWFLEPKSTLSGSFLEGKLLLIYICNFHVLSNLLLIYICKLHCILCARRRHQLVRWWKIECLSQLH